jgi:peptidoglycan/LPS O-acetylase OafA/YrhL
VTVRPEPRLLAAALAALLGGLATLALAWHAEPHTTGFTVELTAGAGRIVVAGLAVAGFLVALVRPQPGLIGAASAAGGLAVLLSVVHVVGNGTSAGAGPWIAAAGFASAAVLGTLVVRLPEP